MTRQTRSPAPPDVTTREVALPPFGLGGFLALPANARQLVVFAHGSGSSRFSPRNTYVARGLQEAGLATLLFDLLQEGEATREKVFDVDLLADRLIVALRWVHGEAALSHLGIGLFGASTGAAAALIAAARDASVSAVVSRGGRPDLAATILADVRAPTLLIVGGNDEVVLELNKTALGLLRVERRLEVVAGATHLFVEPGALDQVIALARDWFVGHPAAPSERPAAS